MLRIILLATFVFVAFSCHTHTGAPTKEGNKPLATLIGANNVQYDTTATTIHIFTALCDNKYQGIVPVPEKIGNGQDLDNNLYWGCAFGVRSYFKASKSWRMIKQYCIDSIKMERLIYKHKTENLYLVADAYNGKYIKDCTVDLLQSCAGQLKDTLEIKGTTIGIYGNAKLLAYTGHDGLMDFSLPASFANADGRTRDVIILACFSKKYFAPHIRQANTHPLVWSTGLMSPEAYTLHDAIETYISKASAETVSNSAAKAYAKYQHCSVAAAKKLLVAGF
jgi:hypothetical protein